MTPKKLVVSLVAALALSTSIVGPTLAAAPTFYGPVTCISFEEVAGLNREPLTLTKKDMAALKKYWVSTTGSCDKGSVDFSAMVKVTTP